VLEKVNARCGDTGRVQQSQSGWTFPLPVQDSKLVGFQQGVGAPTSLVTTTDNSPNSLGEQWGTEKCESRDCEHCFGDDWSTAEFWEQDPAPVGELISWGGYKDCPNPRLVHGECVNHGQQRMVLKRCKSRGCEYCGPLGRYQIAQRIAFGVRQYWPCAWHVLTFGTEEAEGPGWKSVAGRKLEKYVAWLRELIPGLEYAATYELTQRGRLHINLIIGPWKYIPQRVLQKRWGARVWVYRIRDDGTIGKEAAKSYSPEALGSYLSKLEQAVPSAWGRRVSYSKGWPKLTADPLVRKGEINWRHEWELEPHVIASFEHSRGLGWWKPVYFGGGGCLLREWMNLLAPHSCDCFDLVPLNAPG